MRPTAVRVGHPGRRCRPVRQRAWPSGFAGADRRRGRPASAAGRRRGLGAPAPQPVGVPAGRAGPGADGGARHSASSRIANTGRRRAPRLTVEDRAGDRVVALDVPALHPGQQHSSTYRLPTDRRGIFDVGPLVLAQTDPFGLMARRRPVGEVARLWVHPRSHPVPAGKAGSTIEMDGPMDDTAPEGTIAFQGLRPYVVGDDLRMVHWRTTARTGTLMVKKARRHQPPPGGGPARRPGRQLPGSAWFEEAVEVAASLLEQAVRGGAPVRLDTVTGSVTASAPTAPGTPSTFWPGFNWRTPATSGRAVLLLEVESGGSAAVLVTGDRLDDDLASLDRLAVRYRRVSTMMVGAATPSARQLGPAAGVPGRSGRGRAGPVADRGPAMIRVQPSRQAWGPTSRPCRRALRARCRGGLPAGVHVGRRGRRR